MTATITLRHYDDTVDIHDPNTARAIAAAVAAYNRNRSDNRQFRVRRSRTAAVRFRASDVATLNANGIDLVDPFDTAQAVAA